MCGISGWVGPPTGEDEPAVARAMAAALAHRGPDGERVAALPGDGRPAGWFGHRRLRVMDLSDAAEQPMSARGGRIVLSYNGEVYGFRDLRRQLAASGHAFRSTGDTEVVLRAYEEWGPGFVERLDGMFALALWDADRRTLLLARDGFGKKPLFHALRDGRLTFASEIKALARAPWLTLRPDLAQLPAYLALGYVPAPDTLYAGVHELPPGALAEFTPGDGRLRVRDLRRPPVRPRPGPPSRADLEALLGELTTAVSRRLVADVPVGVLLSGGIDSSLVAGLAATVAEAPPRTFTAGFDDAAFDERSAARQVAGALGAEHTELLVRADANALLDRIVWHHDGPFADSSAVPTYLVAQAARAAVSVVLTGDGGDELFAGYQRFAAAAASRLVSPPTARALAPLAALLPGEHAFHGPRRRAARFLDAAGRPLLERYLSWVAVFDPAALGALVREARGADPAASLRAASAEAAALPPIDRLVHINQRTYLPGDLLPKLDRASMAHGLEARSPLLDARVAALANQVAARHKVGWRRPKPLLRLAAGPVVPDAVWRRPKRGFGVPVDAWFHGVLGERFADEVLAPDGRARAHLHGDALDGLLREHRGGRAAHGARLWSVLVLERWLRSLEGPRPLEAPASTAATVTG